MISSSQFIAIIKKHHNRYFSAKQAVSAYIMEFYEVEYSDLKYQNENLLPLIKKTRKTVYTLLRDMFKAGTIGKRNGTTWDLYPGGIEIAV